jgi:uncharacterized protein YfaS (alpha-2-macroglobulin family)
VESVQGKALAHPLDPTDELRQGQMVRVSVTVVAPEPQDFVVVDDPIPAGLEVVNFNLRNVSDSWRALLEAEPARPAAGATGAADAGAAGQRPLAAADRGAYDADASWVNHRELRDDRVLLFSDDLAAGVHRFIYLCQVTRPGRFVISPLRVEPMYTPEIYGRTGGRAVVVKER